VPKNDWNRLCTGFTINSVVGICTEKLFATRLNLTFSRVVISMAWLLFNTLSETKGHTFTVRFVSALPLVTFVVKLAAFL
jgi:hypothetical protein